MAEVKEKKGVTKAQIRATTKWEKENYEKILVRMPKGKREEVKQQADNKGYSLNAYILALLEADKDGGTLTERKAETPKTEQTDTLTAPPDKYITMLPQEYYEKSKRVGIADFDKFVLDTIAVELRRRDDTDKLTIIDRLIKEQKRITDRMRAEGKTQEEIDEALKPIREQMKAMQ